MARSESQKSDALAVLQANGGNIARTSKQLGIPRATLTLWRDGGVSEEVTESCQLKKISLADAMEALVWKCVEVLPEKLQAASAKDAATVMGITTEKMQLLREKPTQITRDDGLTDEQRADGVATLLDRARARRVGQADPSDAIPVN